MDILPEKCPAQKLNVLLSLGYNINKQKKNGRTAYHYACMYGNIGWISALKKAGAVEILDKYQKDPLAYFKLNNEVLEHSIVTFIDILNKNPHLNHETLKKKFTTELCDFIKKNADIDNLSKDINWVPGFFAKILPEILPELLNVNLITDLIKGTLSTAHKALLAQIVQQIFIELI